jgi:hypothetical protein
VFNASYKNDENPVPVLTYQKVVGVDRAIDVMY